MSGLDSRGSLPNDPFCRQNRRGEIEQESLPATGCLQVRSPGGKVDIFKCTDRLQFNNDFPFDQQIEPVLTHFLSTVRDSNRQLPLETQSSSSQFHAHRLLVHRFKEPWSEFPMYGDRGSDYLPRQPFEFHAPGFLDS